MSKSRTSALIAGGLPSRLLVAEVQTRCAGWPWRDAEGPFDLE